MADQESLEDLKIRFWIEKKVACYSFDKMENSVCFILSLQTLFVTSSLSVHFSKLQACQEKLFQLHFSKQLSTAPHLLIPPSFLPPSAILYY